MKKKNSFIYQLLIISAILLSNGKQICGQEKLTILTGIGFPEALNIGVQFRIDQTEMGGSIGLLGAYGSIPLSVNLCYHFGGSSKFSDVHLWYGRVGLDYLFIGTFQVQSITLIYDLRVGRDFNISHKLGIKIDAGAFYSYDKILMNSYISPCLGIRVFYRFIKNV